MRCLLLAAPLLILSTMATAQQSQPQSGTTIVGERESPIGLYISPWRKAAPEENIDRPARLLNEDAYPVDPDVFERQVQYYDALTGHQAAQTAGPKDP